MITTKVILLYICKPLIQKQTYGIIFGLYASSILTTLFQLITCLPLSFIHLE